MPQLPHIAIILPPREGFSPKEYGAVALCVKDFASHSRFREAITVFGSRVHAGFEGIHYQPLPIKKRWYEPYRRAYVRAILRAIPPHTGLIEIHNRPILARKLAALTAIPIALHLHNDPLEMKAATSQRQRRYLLTHCAAIYCISHYIKQRFMEGLSTPADNVHVIHAGIDVPAIPTVKKPEILFAGRMTPNKGALEFAEALALLLPEFLQWRGIFIGGRRHSLSHQASDYEKKVQQALIPLGKHAEFRGFQSHEEVLLAYDSAAVAIIPSLWEEPYGRTALEAAAYGCAVVTSNSGGLKENTGEAGIEVRPVTPQNIAAALKELLTSPDLLHKAQQAAYSRAHHFSNASCVAALDAVRELVLNRKESQ